MTPFVHLSGRARVIGLVALIATTLAAAALGQATGQPRNAAAAPRHTAVSIQRATAVAVGQIARPQRHDPLVGRGENGNGNGDHHKHKAGG